MNILRTFDWIFNIPFRKIFCDFLLNFWGLSGAKVCTSCRSRQELSKRIFTCKNRLPYSRELASQSLPKISQRLLDKKYRSRRSAAARWSAPTRPGRWRRGRWRPSGSAPSSAAVSAASYVCSNSKLERIFSEFYFFLTKRTFRKPVSEKFTTFLCEISGNLRA